MPVGNERFFTKEHIQAHVFGTSTVLAEQAVHCLELVASLSRAGLGYQFKGGNSLLLVLDTPLRFSIDVDIATDEPRERIEECVDRVVRDYGAFTRWTRRRHKTKPWLPIASYYLFFDSHFASPDDAFIMLDVQLRRSPYTTGMKPVACGDIYTADAQVELPLPSSIIGDKLLTLGPATLGIPVGKGKEAQRLKHVFDVSTLLGMHPDLHDIRRSFHACMEHENSLQETKMSVTEVLDDTLAFCGSVARYERPPEVAPGTASVLAENVTGLAPFADHLFAREYSWQQLQKDTARAAACIT
ncbi:MAG: hypothetical protein GF418_12305, partial [Chitinivibrionales bacterium]|nr:hypothetical protein [Chitinivibrionales bacterium]MBD3396401.1 hypothetical protein [Chitinivibrionales bacterium]